MDFKKYIQKFGNKTFNEVPLTPVDGCIIAVLSYANWNLFCPNENLIFDNEICSENIRTEDIKILYKKCTMPGMMKDVLKSVLKSKRFGNFKVKYVRNKQDLAKKQQFFACTFCFDGLDNYIAFRGTDLSVVGWEENLMMVLNVISSSQSDSIEYVSKVSKLIDGNFYIGGHSKGGNMAMYSAMKSSKDIQERIIEVFSFDGTGFYRKDFYETGGYINIKEKIYQIIPTDSFVGMMFYTPREYKIVSSRIFSIFQHIPSTWRITKNGEFLYRKKRTYMTRVRHKALLDWCYEADNETKALTIDAIVTAFGGDDKDLLYYLRHPTFIRRHAVTWFKKYSKEQKRIIIKFAGKLIRSYIKCFFYFLKKSNREESL